MVGVRGGLRLRLGLVCLEFWFCTDCTEAVGCPAASPGPPRLLLIRTGWRVPQRLTPADRHQGGGWAAPPGHPSGSTQGPVGLQPATCQAPCQALARHQPGSIRAPGSPSRRRLRPNTTGQQASDKPQVPSRRVDGSRHSAERLRSDDAPLLSPAAGARAHRGRAGRRGRRSRRWRRHRC